MRFSVIGCMIVVGIVGGAIVRRRREVR